MPYLNWRNLGEQELQKSVTVSQGRHAGSPEHVGFELRLGPQQNREFRAFLAEIFASGGVPQEGRIEMPGDWRLFFKSRQGESRILVAHPDADQWVGTVMLALEDAQKVIQALDLAMGNRVRFSEHLRLGRQTTNGDLSVSAVPNHLILVVEDVATMREMLLRLVGGLPGGARQVGVSNGAELRNAVLKDRPTWVLLDEILPGESSIELGTFLHREGIPYALVSATGLRDAPLPPGCLVRLQKPSWDTMDQALGEWVQWWTRARGDF